MTKEKLSEELLLQEAVLKQNEIVLFNDDVNTFDHVIDTLIYANIGPKTLKIALD